MIKLFRKELQIISFILSVVLICTSFGNFMAYAEDTSFDNYKKVSILKTSSSLVSNDASRTKTDGSYDGYIQTLEDFSSDYLMITYTVDRDVASDTKVFTFQPFNASYSGWEDNIATIGGSTLDNGVYTFYIPTQKVVQSLSTGTIKGLNLSFCPDIGATVTLTGYYTLTENKQAEDDGPTEDEVQLSENVVLQKLTEEDFASAGCSWFGSAKATVYVKITNASKYSWLNAACALGTDKSGKASSKYLQASKCTVKSGGNYIQDGIVGKAGTGYYAFPDVNLNTSTSAGGTLSADEQKKITIEVSTGTKDTDCEILGVKFKNGAVYPKEFKVPTCESASLDVNEAGEKDKLKMSLDYCDKMTSTKYTSDSWQTFQTALTTAKSKYNDSSLSADDYAAARKALEKVKSQLVFVTTTDKGNPTDFRVLTAKEMVSEMGAGWNLGNTMDGHSGFTPSETAWQPTVTTKKMIKSVHDLGINTVRIPVTWGTMIDEDNGYKINEKWISRVQDIVDYCKSLDMYVIINIHHDGAEQSGWLRVSAEDIDPVYEEFECVWRNIAERFKDYDEHLIFESMNEVTSGTNDASYVLYDNPIIMNMNQIFVNVVRSTGSNNTKRWLSVPGHYALPSAVTNANYGFVLPNDSVSNRLFVAAHIYAGPSGFYMGQNMTSTVCNLADCSDMISKIKALATKWSNNGVPVIVGEFGCINKNNPTERAFYTEIFNRSCKNAGMLVPCYWDQGWFDRTQTPADYSFSIIDRENCKPIDKEVTDGLIRGIELSGDVSTLVKNPTITQITDISTDKDNVKLTIGNSETVTATASPTSTNDVLLWKSEDESVATVYRGKIRARGIGSTKVIVFSQSGSAQKEITVDVLADSNSSVTEIKTDTDSYTLAINGYEYINPELVGGNENDFVSYKSADESIATVSSVGKVLGISKGYTTVTATAPNGITKTIQVKVADSIAKDYINLALNVLYNDNSTKYYGNEVGPSIKVTGNGQYTLSFDVTNDLSSKAKNANVTALKNLTAIYIKDLDVTNGEANDSPLENCNIKYDKITVDGVDMTITKTDSKSAVNSAGIFDTGDPINGYDGSVISEVSTSSNICNFKTVTNPKKIEVVFTLSDVKFKEAQADSTITAETITSVNKNISIAKVGDSADVSVSVLPKDVQSKVSFVSSDASIISVSNSSASVDAETGIAKTKVTALKEGTAKITAYIDGISTEIVISVGNSTGVVKGDADNDGQLTINDAVIILDYVLDKKGSPKLNYDMDKNDVIDSRDVAIILKKVLENK